MDPGDSDRPGRIHIFEASEDAVSLPLFTVGVLVLCRFQETGLIDLEVYIVEAFKLYFPDLGLQVGMLVLCRFQMVGVIDLGSCIFQTSIHRSVCWYVGSRW